MLSSNKLNIKQFRLSMPKDSMWCQQLLLIVNSIAQVVADKIHSNKKDIRWYTHLSNCVYSFLSIVSLQTRKKASKKASKKTMNIKKNYKLLSTYQLSYLPKEDHREYHHQVDQDLAYHQTHHLHPQINSNQIHHHLFSFGLPHLHHLHHLYVLHHHHDIYTLLDMESTLHLSHYHHLLLLLLLFLRLSTIVLSHQSTNYNHVNSRAVHGVTVYTDTAPQHKQRK